MEYVMVLKALVSLGIVFAIMFVLLKILQKSTRFGIKAKGTAGINSLKIGNIVYIDEDTKIVNVISETGNNYVLAVGKNNMLLLDKNKVTEEQKQHDKR
jgi:hypothetical protein